jgi:hypothetical protein
MEFDKTVGARLVTPRKPSITPRTRQLSPCNKQLHHRTSRFELGIRFPTCGAAIYALSFFLKLT